MRPDMAAPSDNDRADHDRGLRRLQEMVTPVRDGLEEAIRDLGAALTKAGEAIGTIREVDVAAWTRRSPLAALAVAAGVGIVPGLCLWPRRK
jgi:hypothetical protein